MDFRCYGWILSILSVAAIALGVADVVLTNQFYCSGQSYSSTYCSTTGEPYVWVWVAVGIWAGLPIFFTGLYLLCSASNPGHWRYVSLTVMLSALVFSPALAILSAIELWRGATASWTFYTFTNGLGAGSIMPSGTNPWQAKFAIPLAVGILGVLIFIKTGWMTLTFWCCSGDQGISKTVVVQQSPVVVQQTRPQVIAPPPCNPCAQYAPLPPVNPCGGNSCNLPVRYSGGCPQGYTCGVFNNFASPNPSSFYYTNTR